MLNRSLCNNYEHGVWCGREKCKPTRLCLSYVAVIVIVILNCTTIRQKLYESWKVQKTKIYYNIISKSVIKILLNKQFKKIYLRLYLNPIFKIV